MDANGLHIRDRIEITPQFISRLPLSTIRSKQIGSGITPNLTFVGREVILKGETQIDNFNVTIIADTLATESSNSKLLIRQNESVAEGNTGKPGYAVNLLCRNLRGIKLSSQGGQGGKGLPYADGEGQGTDGIAAEDCANPEPPFTDCSIEIVKSPGKGIQGRQGFQGGLGGQIVLSYVNDLIPGGFNLSLLESMGGLGGLGASGGPGGCTLIHPFVNQIPGDPFPPPPPPPSRNCSAAFRGPQGSAGEDGLQGGAGSVQGFGIPEADYWSKVIAFLGAGRTAAWAKYRLQAAEYYFRAFNPADPQHANDLTIALTEAKAVQKLDPSNAQAGQYRSYIANNLNVLGQPRNLSVIPDFEADYEQVLSQYDPELRQIFDQPNNLISDELVFEAIAPVLTNQLNELNTMLAPEGELAQNKVEAQDRIDEGERLRMEAADRLLAITAEIPSLEVKIQNNEGSDFLGIDLSDGLQLVGGVALGVLSNVALPGAGGALVSQLLPYAQSFVGTPPILNDLNAVLDNAGTILNGLEQKVEDGLDQGLALIDNDAKGLADYAQSYLADPQGWEQKLKNEWNGAQKAALDFAKVAQELGGAQATSSDPEQQQRQQRLIALYQEQAALTQQQFQMQLQIQEATADKERIERLIARVTADRDVAAASVSENTTVQRKLREGVLASLRSAQAFQGRLMKFFFRAAKALQLYTLAVNGQESHLDSTLVPYAYGYLHPDDEANYLEEVATDPNQSPATVFRQKLTKAVPPFAALNYFDIYDSYRKLGQKDGLRSGYNYPVILDRINHPQAIAEFIETGKLFFNISLDDLARERPGVFEAKVTKVSLELEGVTANAPFTSRIRHSGKSFQQRYPSSSPTEPVYQVLLPTFDIITLDRVDPAIPDLYGGETVVTNPGEDQRIVLSCWGRGIASDWTLEIDRNANNQLPVSLQNLSEIKLLISFDAKDSDPGSTIQSIHHAAGALQAVTTTYATLTLMEAAPAQGTPVKLTSSDSTLVKVPGTIVVPSGATSITIPMEAQKGAAGKTVTLTATTRFTLKTQLQFPPLSPTVSPTLSLGTKPDYQSTVLGVVANGRYLYATQYYAKIADGHESFGKGELVVVDGTTFKEVPNTRVPLGFQPRSIAVNPVTKRIYATNYSQESYSLSILDCTDAAKPQAITELKLGQVPIDVAVNSQTNRIYVTNPFQKKIHVIDGTTNTELQSIALSSRPSGIAVNEKTNTLYVTLSDRSVSPLVNAIAVVKITGTTGTQTQVQIQTIPIFENPDNPDPTRPTQPVDIAFNPATNRLYIANLGGGGIAPCVTVFDLTTQKAKNVKTISGARAIAVNPILNQVYIGTDSGVQIMDGATQTIVSTVPQNLPWGVTFNPTTQQIYAGSVREGVLSQMLAPNLNTITQWV